MPIYIPPPIFTDNAGQMLSHEDLEIIRQNVGYAELLSYRMMPGFPSSGGPDTSTVGWYPGDVDFSLWIGNIRFKTGMTTLAVQGTAANWGDMDIKVYVNGVLRITITPAATWQGTWTLTGFTDGQVIPVEVKADYHNGDDPDSSTKFVVTAVYGTPIAYGVTWPGVPTFTTAWTAAKLNQLVDAAEWVYNRATATPIRPDLSVLYGLAPFSGNSYPIYVGSIGRWFSNSQFAFSGQVNNGANPGFVLKFYFDGVLVYTTANIPIGCTDLFFTLSLAGYAVGQQIELKIVADNNVAAARSDWSYSRVTIRAARSQVDTSAVYTNMTATPLEDVLLSPATTAAYLNNLAATVLAAYNRIQNTPAVFNRVWGVRRFFSKTNKFSDFGQKRGRPRFIRTGHRLIVRGKNVSIAWGPFTVPTNERGLQWEDYTLLHSQNIIDGDHDSTQTVYLDTLPGLAYGIPYFLIGDVQWCEESII